MTWDSGPTDTQSALQDGINQVADTLASRYAVINDSHLQSSYTIIVSNINQLSDFGKLNSILRHTDAIDQFSIRDMNESGVVLHITSSASLTKINRALLTSHKLIPQTTPDEKTNTLTYSWNLTNKTMMPKKMTLNNTTPDPSTTQPTASKRTLPIAILPAIHSHSAHSPSPSPNAADTKHNITTQQRTIKLR